jgi:hypothetical protein
MQGINYLDLAKVIAGEHYTNNPHSPAPKTGPSRANRTRQWAGRHLIQIGERMIPKSSELQLKVSTGPPCP